VEIVTPHHVRFHLHEPWSDFLTFYATPATGVSWIVPKHDTEKVGPEKFKQHPVVPGPYRFVDYEPGVELVLEAHTPYWRQVPHVKRLVLKSVPEPGDASGHAQNARSRCGLHDLGRPRGRGAPGPDPEA
jgi:peptide/nickel transport system substrate-binding protein